MRISDWSSDVCSSDLQQHIVDIIPRFRDPRHGTVPDAARSSVVGRQGKMIVTTAVELPPQIFGAASKVALHMVAVDPQLRRRSRHQQIGRASCRERVCQSVSLSVVAVTLKKKKK